MPAMRLSKLGTHTHHVARWWRARAIIGALCLIAAIIAGWSGALGVRAERAGSVAASAVPPEAVVLPASGAGSNGILLVLAASGFAANEQVSLTFGLLDPTTGT